MKCKIKVSTSFIIAIVALIIVIKLCAQLENLVGILYHFTYIREQSILLSILLFSVFVPSYLPLETERSNCAKGKEISILPIIYCLHFSIVPNVYSFDSVSANRLQPFHYSEGSSSTNEQKRGFPADLIQIYHMIYDTRFPVIVLFL